MTSVPRQLGILAGIGFLGALGSMPGYADTPASTGEELGEIVVTAQRRTERLQEVPMSIQAFSQEVLDQQGIRSVDDLTRVSPGVTFFRNGMSSSGNYNDEDSDISIRGIDSTAGAATTGIYVDDTPIQTRHLNFGTVNPYPALFDLKDVEVLKGPQGTLFGAGSEGGTIRFITPEASLTDYSGYARAEYGKIDNGGNSYSAGAALGGPIIQGVLGFRVSASFQEDGGWVNRVTYKAPPTVVDPASGIPLYVGNPVVTGVTEKNANWHDTQTFRAALKWQPVDGLSIDPSILVQTLHINDTGAYWLNISNPSSNVYNNGNAQRDPSTDPWYLGSLKVTWHQPWADIISNTSYFDRQQHSISDYSQWYDTVFLLNQYPLPNQINSAYFADRQDNFNEEIRASSADSSSPLQWSAGLFYTHTNEDSTEYVVAPAGCTGNCPLTAPGFPAGQLVYLQPRFSLLDKQAAVFGEVTWKFADVFRLTAGIRYSDLQYYGVVQEIEQGSFGSLNVNTPSSGSSRPLTPRFVFKYQPDSNSLYYASAAKGFRPGGINTRLPSSCLPTGLDQAAAAAPFSSDSLWQYEVGFKNTLLDHRLTVNGSVYYIKWKNIQQFVYLACGLGFDYNLGEVTGKGGDLEVQWRALESLTLGLMASYTDSSFNDSVILPGSGTDQLVASGDHLQASPWNLDLNGEYVFAAPDFKPYLRLDYQYATAQRSLIPYLDPANNPNADATLPGLPEIRVLNVRGGVRFNGFDLSLFATNALNYHTPIFVSRDFNAPVYGLPNLNNNYFGRGYAPRTVGVTGTYRF